MVVNAAADWYISGFHELNCIRPVYDAFGFDCYQAPALRLIARSRTFYAEEPALLDIDAAVYGPARPWFS